MTKETQVRDQRSALGRSSRRLAGAFLVAICFVSALASGAQAEYRYVPEGAFGNGVLGERPTGLSVDQTTGDILVADPQNGRIAVFGAGGTLIATISGGPLTSPYGVAIDQSNGALYVSDAGAGQIVKYATDRAEPPTYTLDGTYLSPTQGSAPGQVGNFASPLAVDPSDGDLLIADTGNLRIERFDSSGAFQGAYDGSTRPQGAFTSLQSVGVGSGGDDYVVADGEVAELGGTRGAVVNRFTAGGTFVEALIGPEMIGPEEFTRARSIGSDPGTGDLLVGAGGGFDVFFSSFPATLSKVEGGKTVESQYLPGREPGFQPTSVPMAIGFGDLARAAYVLTASFTPEYPSDLNQVRVFGRAFAPEVAIDDIDGIAPREAVVHGEVDPGGEAGATYHLEYRVKGELLWQETTSVEVPSPEPEPVAVALTGLLPNQRYEVRLVAANHGVGNESAVKEFSTAAAPPTITAEGVTSIGETSATITASIDPQGSQTTYQFEYGPTLAYGSQVPVRSEAVAGGEHGPRAFARAISGLNPGSVYHYRVVARNAAGATFGPDQTFMTLGVGGEPSRVFEQVSPVDAEGGILDPLLGLQVKADGSAVSYLERPSGGPVVSHPLLARFMGTRGATDWNSGVPIDPRLDVARNYVEQTTLAISKDFKHTFVATNRPLTAAGGVAGGLNLYVLDLETGAAHLVAGTEAAGAFALFTGLATANKFAVGAADFHWVIFASPKPLLPGVTGNATYRWSEERGLELVSALPGGEAPPDGTTSESQYGNVRTASDDGSKVYFTTVEEPAGRPTGVYLSENSSTVPVSVSQISGSGEAQTAVLGGASSDGRYAIVASPKQLTADAPEPAELRGGWSLYRYDATSHDLTYMGSETRIGLSFVVEGIVSVSADGNTVYFMKGESLYVWRDGTIKFVAEQVLTQSRGFLSPNGRYFAFSTSVGPSEEGEVYLFDSESGDLACVSCSDPDTHFSFLLTNESVISRQLPQAVDDAGEVFFQTDNALVPADINARTDVYGYRDGVVHLVSPGTGPFDARFGGISETGRDVFFFTEERLVSRDENQSLDLYVARIGGGLADQNLNPGQACSSESCQAETAPGPGAPVSGSETVTPAAGKKPHSVAPPRCKKSTAGKGSGGGKKKHWKSKQCVKRSLKAGGKRKKPADGGNR